VISQSNDEYLALSVPKKANATGLFTILTKRQKQIANLAAWESGLAS